MMGATHILPGTGRGTMRSMVEGRPSNAAARGRPSATPALRHLPVPGRIAR